MQRLLFDSKYQILTSYNRSPFYRFLILKTDMGVAIDAIEKDYE